MNINRHNYEEFFLLYVDNELSAAERNAVDIFVQENADLKEELLMLQQTVFNTEAVVFENKHTLLKEELTPLQENLLLYVDNELSAAGILNMQQLLNADAAANKELALLQHTKLQADTAIIFPNKKSLYKKETGRVVGMPWFRIAAAAILLGFGTWATVSVVNNINKADDVSDVAKKTETKTTLVAPITGNTIPEQAKKINNTNVNTAAVNNTGVTNTISPKNNQPVQNNVKQNLQPVKENNTVAKQDANKKLNNNLPTPDYNNFNNINKADDVSDVAKKTETKTTLVAPITGNTIPEQAKKINNTNVNTAAVNNTGVTNTISPKNNQPVQNNVKQNLQPVKENNTVAKQDANKKLNNNLPTPDYNNFNNNERNKTDIAYVPPTEEVTSNLNSGDKTAVAASNEKINNQTINPYALITNFKQDNAEEEDNANEDKSKKTKLGGFFRKVKRLVERNTNIKTGDGIKVAGFDIAIK